MYYRARDLLKLHVIGSGSIPKMLKYKLLHNWLLPPIRNCLAWGSEYWSVQVTGVYARPNVVHQHIGNMEHTLTADFLGCYHAEGVVNIWGDFPAKGEHVVNEPPSPPLETH